MMSSLCERLGIDIPVIQAPMGGAVGPALAAEGLKAAPSGSGTSNGRLAWRFLFQEAECNVDLH